MEEKFKPTREWMEKTYNELNSTLFHNELGECNLNVFTTGHGASGNVLGWFKIAAKNIRVKRATRRIFRTDYWSGNEDYVNNDNFYELCQPKIELNGNYSWTKHAMRATLAHEMCHYYTYMNGYVPVQAHGPEFRSIGAIITSRSKGEFTIQRLADAEQLSEMELDADVKAKNDKRLENKISKLQALLIFYNSGIVKLTTTSHQDLIDNIISQHKRYSKDTNKILLSNDKNFIELLWEKGYRLDMRTYRWWEFIGLPSWLENVLSQYNFKDILKSNPEPEKPKRKFVINFTNGEKFEVNSDNPNIIRQELIKKFPNWKPEVIDMQINKQNNYVNINEMRTINLNTLKRMISEAIKNELNNIDSDSIAINPNDNLGIKSIFKS